MNIPTFSDVLPAHERIKPCIHRTPVLTSSSVKGLTRTEQFFMGSGGQLGGRRSATPNGSREARHRS